MRELSGTDVVRLVLFDIDGTLIRTGGAGVKAFERTFAEEFDLPEATKSLSFAGRTDVSLVRECFGLHQITPSEENFRRFFEQYPRHLRQLLRALPGGICEGVLSFLEGVQRHPSRPAIGLLTGNVRLGAELKLTHYELWHQFAFGGFGDDHEDRNCIAAIAQQRGEEKLARKLEGKEIVVIGDTPLDVACGHSIGAKVLAVATGTCSKRELQATRPRWAVDNLGEIQPAEVLEG